MIGTIVADYHIEALGAPFPVHLLNSVTRDAEGSVTVPEPRDLLVKVAIARLRRARRLGGAEIAFLRRSVDLGVDDVARSCGLSAEETTRYESGERTMTQGLEKYVRLLLFHHLRRELVHEGRQDMLDYIDWITEEWDGRPTAADDATMRLAHAQGRGWHLV